MIKAMGFKHVASTPICIENDIYGSLNLHCENKGVSIRALMIILMPFFHYFNICKIALFVINEKRSNSCNIKAWGKLHTVFYRKRIKQIYFLKKLKSKALAYPGAVFMQFIAL